MHNGQCTIFYVILKKNSGYVKEPRSEKRGQEGPDQVAEGEAAGKEGKTGQERPDLSISAQYCCNLSSRMK